MSRYLSETDFDFKNKAVLLRIDADVDLEKDKGKLVVDEDFRLRSVLPTIKQLKEKGAKKIILLGHLGRPGGEVEPDLSLGPVADWFSQRLNFCQLIGLDELGKVNNFDFCLLENLRFNKGERANKASFAKRVAALGEAYVNDAFGSSHRQHASIVGIPQFLPAFLGLRMEGEIKALVWLKERAPRPLVFVLGGSKPGKLNYLEFLSSWADHLLVGGKLPALIKEKELKLNNKVAIARLEKSGKDIDARSMRKFKDTISRGKTVAWAGPMGVYEEESHEAGTWAIARAAAEAKAFRVAGGGDTHRIISRLEFWKKFDFVSVGGGAMLQFLQKGSLFGIEAVGS